MASQMNLEKKIEAHVRLVISEEQANTILKVWLLKKFNVDSRSFDPPKEGNFKLTIYNNHDTGERLTHYVCKENKMDNWDLVIFH